MDERSMYTEILIGLLKKICKDREDLRIVVMSSSNDVDVYIKSFGIKSQIDAEEKKSAGLVYMRSKDTFCPRIHYLRKSTRNFIKEALKTCLNIHTKEEKGNILVYMPGVEEVEEAIREFHRCFRSENIHALTLHTGSPTEIRMKVAEFTLMGDRCVLFTTNTIENWEMHHGVKFVVDVGLCKLKCRDSHSSLEKVVMCNVSKSLAIERVSRAFTKSHQGKYFRLMTKENFTQLPLQTPSELQRSDMSWPILLLKAIGVQDIMEFDFLLPPREGSVKNALEVLGQKTRKR